MAELEVQGVAEMLRTLKQLDPELRKSTVKAIKAPAKVILATARATIPNEAPMSGWRGGTRGNGQFPKWNPGAAKKGVKLKFSSSMSQRKRQWDLLRVVQTDAAGAVFDMAGKNGGSGTRQSQQFLANLRAFGSPSRDVWPAVEKHSAEVTAAIRVAVAETEAILNARLKG
jgi:hypothetical protein